MSRVRYLRDSWTLAPFILVTSEGGHTYRVAGTVCTLFDLFWKRS